MKYFLYKNSLPFTLISPGTIKKFFHGKGNATKDLMYDAFVEKTGVDLYKLLGIRRGKKVESPINDIVDSYALALYGRSMSL